MLRPAPMELLSVIVLDRDVDGITRMLLKTGVMHLVSVREFQMEAQGLERPETDKRQSCCHDVQKRAREMLHKLGVTKYLGRQEADQRFVKLNIDGITHYLEEIEKALNPRLQELERLQVKLKERESWYEQIRMLGGWDIGKVHQGDYAFLEVHLGKVKTGNFFYLEKGLTSLAHAVLPLRVTGPDTETLVITLKKDRGLLDKVLEQAGFVKIDLPMDEHPENGSLIQQRIDELHDSLALDASRYVPILENLLVLASAGSDVTDAQSNYLKSTRTYLISGWLPVSRRQNIIRNIRARTRALFFIDEERPEGIAAVRQRRQKVPVLLDNPKFLQPFELLLTAFGLPEYYAVDPTIFVAVSYLIMFGVMFGDIGHGTVLGISGYIFSRKAGGMLSAFGILAAYCGGAAIVFGFLYGKFFGLALLNPLWRDPFDDVSRFLMTAVIGGLVMINAGILLHGANAWKSRNIFASVQDRGSGQGLIQAVQSIIKIMEAVLRYAVNALSFARVAAFALAHAGLLMAVFDLAEMVQQAVGVAGSTAVLILGNIFIIFFEGMIVAIQALRLEYYEFFSRFFEPSGEPYRPVKFNPIT